MAVDFSKKDKFTPLERIGRLIAGEPVDRVAVIPFALSFSARLAGIDRGTYYREPERAFEAGLACMKAYPWTNASPTYAWADMGAWEFGGQIVWPDNGESAAPGLSGPLSRDPRKSMRFPIPTRRRRV